MVKVLVVPGAGVVLSKFCNDIHKHHWWYSYVKRATAWAVQANARRACRRTSEWMAIVASWRRPRVGYRNRAKKPNLLSALAIPASSVIVGSAKEPLAAVPCTDTEYVQTVRALSTRYLSYLSSKTFEKSDIRLKEKINNFFGFTQKL